MTRMLAGVVGFVNDDCMTVTAWPPMKTNPERDVDEVFAAIV